MGLQFLFQTHGAMVAERRKVHHIFKYGGRCQVGQFIVSNHTTFIFQYLKVRSYYQIEILLDCGLPFIQTLFVVLKFYKMVF